MNKKYSRFPMKVLVIVDKDLKVVKTYQQRGVTLSDVEITESVISDSLKFSITIYKESLTFFFDKSGMNLCITMEIHFS